MDKAFSENMDQEPKSLVLEIGSHRGDVLAAMARNHPDSAFMGMDITFKRVVNLLKKLRKMASAMSRQSWVTPKPFLFCSKKRTGWHYHLLSRSLGEQKRQKKNRLLNREFLR